MYYYIAEPVVTQAERRRLEDIKTALSQLGIAGEFAVASPARTVEEHLALAFSRGFTTIVGIGSDALISRVAGCMLSHKYEKGVLGVIPYSATQTTARMIEVSGLTQVTAALRARGTVEIDAIQFGHNQAAITPVIAELPADTQFHLRYKDVLLEGRFSHLRVSPGGVVELWQSTRPSGLKIFGRLWGQSFQPTDSTLTRLQLDRWDFATADPCSLTVGGETIAETPFEAIRRKKALKLIVNRATITPVKDQND